MSHIQFTKETSMIKNKEANEEIEEIGVIEAIGVIEEEEEVEGATEEDKEVIDNLEVTGREEKEEVEGIEETEDKKRNMLTKKLVSNQRIKKFSNKD